jgi:glycosyltransferase involved in cell wall biosynthesis
VKVWLVTVGEPLPLAGNRDKLIRTGHLAHHLREEGHDVVWWSSTFDHFRKRHHLAGPADLRLEDGVLLKLLHAPPYRSNISLARLRHQLATAVAFTRDAQLLDAPDVILCAFPTIELARAAVRFGHSRGCRVALDVRDLWPDIFVDALPRGLRPLGAPVVRAYDRLAREALRGADGLVAVSEGYLAWALDKAGRSRSPVDAVLPIGFSPPAHSRKELDAARGRLVARGVRFEKTLAVFVGSFGRTYDLATVLGAARLLQATLPQLQFVLAGDGENGRRWRGQARGLANVVMPGWLDGGEVAALCGAAAVGLQSYARRAPQGLANKLFEYLGYGLALVSCLEGENGALIERHGCGLNYRPGDPGSLAERLSSLLAPGSLARARRNAAELFEREFRLPLIHRRFSAYLMALSKFPGAGQTA